MITVASLASLPMVFDLVLGFSAFFFGSLATTLFFIYGRPQTLASELQKAHGANQTEDNDAARTSMAVQQIRDLVRNVASDVGAHQSLVGGFSDQLGAIQDSSCDHGQIVKEIVSKLLEANSTVQHRLEDAERKIHAQAEEIRTQQSEARTDALTNLPNRRAFDQCLKDNTQRTREHGRPFSLLLFDIDHFKRFNDAYGHLAGDAVLRAVGRAVASVLKEGDVAARYGGEEFAVIMPNCQGAATQAAAERVRQAVEKMTIEFEGQRLRVTASIGVAESCGEPSEEALIRRADEGVYASKQAGRNCSHWHNGLDCLPINALGKQPAAAREVEGVEIGLNPAGMTSRTANLLNGDAFTEMLKRRIPEARRSGSPLSVLHFSLMDLSGLATIYGKATDGILCDSLLTAVGSTLRDMDSVGRLAEGMFVVMLPGSSEMAAKIVGQRVKAAVCSYLVAACAGRLQMEVEVGAVTAEAGEGAAALMARVQAAAHIPAFAGVES